MAQQILSTNTFTTAKWIVSSTASDGTHTTLAGAMASASSGDTIFLRTSVTENVTITPGVNITAWSGGSLNTPSITGTLTMTAAGTSTISGLELITNSAAIIAVTGSAASILNVNNCYLNCGTSAITYSSSNASSAINITNCQGNISTTGIAMFTHSSTGTLTINNSTINNTGLSVTAATASAGTLNIFFSYIEFAITTSGTNLYQDRNTHRNTSTINTTGLTAGGAGANIMRNSYCSSGTASAISVGSTLVITGGGISSSNTNAITGAGTLIYSGIAFSNSSLINTTTQSGGISQGGQFQAPSAGYIGEQIRSAVAQASAVTLASNTVSNVTSISLTAGIWDVSGIVTYGNSATGTGFASSITSTTAGLGTSGDNAIAGTASPNATQDMGYSIPSYRFTLSATTTIFLTAFATVTVGTMKAFGRISGTRVG